MPDYEVSKSELNFLEQFDYRSPTNLAESASILDELELPVEKIENIKRTTITQVESLLLLKDKAIYDIEDVDGLSGKVLVFWVTDEHYFISLTSNLGNYNRQYDFKFKSQSRQEVINEMNKELEKYNFEVPIDSGKWR